MSDNLTPNSFPIVPQDTVAPGIFQSDIIVRAGLEKSLAELRANPWLLDYCFASLVQDDLTAGVHGRKQVDLAKAWFARTKIPVVMDYLAGTQEAVMIIVSLTSSAEAENTTGDDNYESQEPVDAVWPVLAGPFVAVGYDPDTKILRVPQSLVDGLVLAPTMVVVDDVGGIHEIECIDDLDVTLTTGVTASFSNAFIKGAQPKYRVYLESLNFKETVNIICKAHGEPQYLTWLHSIVVFALLRYKQKYFEARGFERSQIASGPFSVHGNDQEKFHVRGINLTGFGRNWWPKAVTEKVHSAAVGPLRFSKVNETGVNFVGDIEDPQWLASTDGLGVRFSR